MHKSARTHANTRLVSWFSDFIGIAGEVFVANAELVVASVINK